MKTKLLELLEDANRTYRSGQEISDHLNVSRTAVWKHIESLRQEGYGIEAVPRRGYRIVSRPNTLNESEVRKGLIRSISVNMSVMSLSSPLHKM